MLNYIRRDYASVRAACKWITNDKAPEWAIIIWYVLLLPIGILLLPAALLFREYYKRQAQKLFEEINRYD